MSTEKALKALYQTVKVRVPEIISNRVLNYNFEKTLNHDLKSDLKERTLEKVFPEFNVMAICPIANWEGQMLDELSRGNSYAHLDFGGRGFFDSKSEWLEFKHHNAELLSKFFEKNYDANKINLVFLYISDFHISDNIDYLKCQNTIVVLFTWDDRLNFKAKAYGQSTGIVNLAKQVDLVLNMTVSPLPRYKLNGISAINWNSLVANLLSEDDNSLDVLPTVTDENIMFFGSNYGHREKIVEYLVSKKIPMKLYGSGWGTGFLSYDELWSKVPKVRLNLGISTVGYTKSVFCLKGRDFEVPGSGGLYLSSNSLELQEVYTPETDILTYQNLEGCYAKCSDVLENPHLYEQIRKNGYQTANRYSWKRRIEALFRLILIIGQ